MLRCALAVTPVSRGGVRSLRGEQPNLFLGDHGIVERPCCHAVLSMAFGAVLQALELSFAKYFCCSRGEVCGSWDACRGSFSCLVSAYAASLAD